MKATLINASDAWQQLLAGATRVYSQLGFFALGDAYEITKDSTYANQIVLVEHRNKHQYNHWGYRCDMSQCKYPATIFTNGNDGYGGLRRKAKCLKLIDEG